MALRNMTNKATPQHRPMPGKAQVKNNAGGYTFQIDDWERLNRFLILGVDQGSYYANAQSMALDNADVLRRCIADDPRRVVDAAVAISDAGRAPSNDPAIFALALTASEADQAGRTYALQRMPEVCRIGTHLFHFVEFVNNHRGWGPGLRKGVSRWYEDKDADKLAYQVMKYRNRDGWTHHDVLRLAHPTAPTAGHGAVFDFVRGRENSDMPAKLKAFKQLQEADSVDSVVSLVDSWNMPWETIPTQFLKSPEIWKTLISSGSLPLGAMVRNLGRMSAIGVFDDRDMVKVVKSRLGDKDEIVKSRLHPIAVLKATAQYASGRSRGDVTWTPVSDITDALNEAFYAAFGNVEPADKRTYIGIDVSGSMGGWGFGPLTPMQVATAMSMVTVASEPDVYAAAFSHEMVPCDISPKRRLDDQIRALQQIRMGRTNCALPMLDATSKGLNVDTFVIYTDNETWCGNIHPMEALKQYRQKSGISAKLVVVGITATEFSIADPDDLGTLDIAGFDSATPNLISEFSKGF